MVSVSQQHKPHGVSSFSIIDFPVARLNLNDLPCRPSVDVTVLCHRLAQLVAVEHTADATPPLFVLVVVVNVIICFFFLSTRDKTGLCHAMPLGSLAQLVC